MYATLSPHVPRHALASTTVAAVVPAPEDDVCVQARERRIDDELAQSFPASDPPSWVHGTLSAQG